MAVFRMQFMTTGTKPVCRHHPLRLPLLAPRVHHSHLPRVLLCVVWKAKVYQGQHQHLLHRLPQLSNTNVGSGAAIALVMIQV